MPYTLRISRRQLLVRAALTGGAVAFGVACVTSRKALKTADGGLLEETQRRTLAAVQDTLLPSGPGSPGARDINAIGYLDAALADPSVDPDDVALVRTGAARLEKLSRERKGRGFAELPESDREGVLRAFQSDDEDGSEWIGVMLVFTLEALLADPVYGGNTGEAGWKWLEHQPGIPRPPAPWHTRRA